MKKEFLRDIVKSTQSTHYARKRVAIQDSLRVDSEAYKSILKKPERYSIFQGIDFDCIFFKRKSLEIDRAILIKDMDDIIDKGLFYKELALIAESINVRIDIVSETEQGLSDYQKRVEDKGILTGSGDYIITDRVLPKSFINDSFLRKHQKLNRRFQKNNYCPVCASKLKVMSSTQKGLKNKYVYLCPSSSCNYKTVVSKPYPSGVAKMRPVRIEDPREMSLSVSFILYDEKENTSVYD